MDIEGLKTMTTAQLALAAETRIGAARIAYRTGEGARASHELDYAEYYVREIRRRLIAETFNSTQEG